MAITGVVVVCEGLDHPRAGRRASVCVHHVYASAKGMKLQIQRLQKDDKTRNRKQKEEYKLRIEKAEGQTGISQEGSISGDN